MSKIRKISRASKIWCPPFLLLAFMTIGILAWAQEPPGQEEESLGGVRAVGLNPSTQDVTPSDVYTRLLFLQSELEQIRFEMGRPKPIPGGIVVTAVAPHEVYFQAATLFKKANRLSFEHTRETASVPLQADSPITPTDVMVVIENAFARISHVKRHLEILQSNAQPTPDTSKTPTDVFHAILQTNRQLNLLLDQQFSPAEVYAQVTLAIGYTARLRAQFPGDRIPETPPFVRGKRPIEVQRKLLDCLTLIQHLFTQSGLPMLRLAPRKHNNDTNGENFPKGVEVSPSDVYDTTTLLVSELAYLWSQLDNPPPPRPAYFPGRRLPSHVDQRVRLLEQQLTELGTLVETTPDWLTRK